MREYIERDLKAIERQIQEVQSGKTTTLSLDELRQKRNKLTLTLKQLDTEHYFSE